MGENTPENEMKKVGVVNVIHRAKGISGNNFHNKEDTIAFIDEWHLSFQEEKNVLRV